MAILGLLYYPVYIRKLPSSPFFSTAQASARIQVAAALGPYRKHKDQKLVRNSVLSLNRPKPMMLLVRTNTVHLAFMVMLQLFPPLSATIKRSSDIWTGAQQHADAAI
jgi:hypothetical protein